MEGYSEEYFEDFHKIFDICSGHWKTAILRAVVSLGFIDIIQAKTVETGGNVPSSEVASLCQTDKDFTYRLLRAASTLGVVKEHETPQYSFTVTRLGSLLLKEREDSARGLVLWEGSKELCRIWLELEKGVKTGKKVIKDVFGCEFFQFIIRSDPESIEILKRFEFGMASWSHFDTNAVLERFDFSKYQSICDVGAGPGILLKAILKKYPQIRGVISDLPQVVEQAVFIDESLQDRCSKEPCDFFQSVPRNHDLYIMKHVLHDWDDDNGVQILKIVNECCPLHAKLLLLEYVVPDSNVASSGKLFDLHMAIVNNGKERTEEEWKKLLVAGGWKYLGYENTKGIISIILASKE
ncbi:hypothetical protein GpartN1_g1257.t1 [Galdieria partita]|uniref:O-methyltransferase n=1 Tax=Galdieria partita TaxID=83374 RepID=A0A9C7PTA7_9RHOD|nr:hypothetical protein GpartN1_g1257.t1 [Galdieria partita]